MSVIKKIIIAAVLAAAAVCAASAAPEVISESAVLIDADTGQVLYEKAKDEKRFPASITKIATVITGLEHANLNDKITMSYDAVFSVSRNASHIALDVDEEISFEDACYAALLMSANDACNGIAEHCSKSMDAFVEEMNATMQRAGAQNTHFSNTNGLKDENHYTTAYDMALICKYALKNEDFRRIFGAYKHDVPPNNKQKNERHFINQHSMISDPDFMYDGVIGGKAGWTTDAQYTLVTAAERDGRTLIAVVMKSPRNDDKYTDTKALFDYGFSEFETMSLTEEELPENTTAEGVVSIAVPKGTKKEDISFSQTMQNGKDYIKITSKSGAELGLLPCTVEIDATELPAGAKPLSALSVIGIIFGCAVLLVLMFLAAITVRKKIYRARRMRRRRR